MSLAMRQVPFIRFVAVGNGRHEADLYLLFSSLMGSSKKSSRPPTHSHNMHTPNQSCTDINTHVCNACIQTAKNLSIFCFVSVQCSLRQ